MTSAEHRGAPTAQPRPGERLSSGAVRALAFLHRLAEAGWATTAVGTWGFLQASVVPGPVDGVLVPLGLADPQRAWRFAASALLGAVLGSLVAYTIGAVAFESVGRAIITWRGVSGPELEQFRSTFKERGLWLVLVSTVTPLSAKLVAIGAGAFGVPILPFVATIALGRAVRYGVVAAVVRYFGDYVERYIEKRYGKTLDDIARRSEEHTSELQSRQYLV